VPETTEQTLARLDGFIVRGNRSLRHARSIWRRGGKNDAIESFLRMERLMMELSDFYKARTALVLRTV